MEYTKGNWKVNRFKVECNNKEIATLPAPMYIYRKPECDGNAQLIASAPDLYEALKDLVGICEEFFFEDQLEQANKAIAKVESK